MNIKYQREHMYLTATDLKQKTISPLILKEEDIVITKRDKPFAIIVDFEKYNQLVSLAYKSEIDKKLEALNSLGSFSLGGKSYKEIKAEHE